MKSINLFVAIFVFSFSVLGLASSAHAEEAVSQYVTLESGWNIVSTPKVLESHTFSIDETSENFDVYLLDASQPTGWATMADLGQSEFTPLYGYFINNKTGEAQTLTFNYDTTVAPNDKLFERTFSSEGWYSIGVANDEYAKAQGADTSDTNNPSRILSLLEGKYDLVIDFTNVIYGTVRKSVALNDPWKAVAPVDIDNLNDFRETKGYAMYVKEANAKYVGFQNDAIVSTDKLVVKSSSNNPDSTTLQLENDSSSDWMSIFAFDLDTEDSINDVEVSSLEVTVTLSSSTYDVMVDDAELLIGGDVITDVTVTNGTTSSAVLTFTPSSPIVIGAGDKINAELLLKFEALASGDEGVQVYAEVTSSNAVAIGTSDIVASGSAIGNSHTLRTAGIDVTNTDSSATVTTNDGSLNDYATFEIEIEVTAIEQDVFIATNPETSITYTLQDASGIPVIEGGRSVALVSTADENGSYFEVNEGETENFTLYVTYVPGVNNVAARLVLNSISFAPTSVAPTQTQLTVPATDYRTSIVTIVN